MLIPGLILLVVVAIVAPKLAKAILTLVAGCAVLAATLFIA